MEKFYQPLMLQGVTSRFVGDGCSNILPSSLGALHVQIVFRYGGDERSNALRLWGDGCRNSFTKWRRYVFKCLHFVVIKTFVLTSLIVF